MSTKKLNKKGHSLNGRMNRTFSEAFKRKKVREILEKKVKVHQVCDIYKVSRTSVYKWIYKYSELVKGTKLVLQMDSETMRTKYLQDQVKELERVLGQKQMEIELLSRTLEQASNDLGFDIKKKYAQR